MDFPMYIDDYDGYQDGDAQIEKEMNLVWAENQNLFQSWQMLADKDTRFFGGDQSMYRQYYGNLITPGEMQFNFNQLLRVHNMILGHKIRNQKSPQAIPQENSDSKTASQFSGMLQWNFKAQNFYNLDIEACSQALITGFGAIELWIDKRSDPVSPDIKGFLRGYSNTIFDPYAQQKDLSDSGYFWTRSYMTPREAKMILPFKTKDIDFLSRNTGYKDEKFIFMLENWNLTPRKLTAVDSYWHLCHRKAKIIVDLYSGDYFEIGKDLPKEAVQMMLQSGQGRLELVNQEIPSVKLAIAVNGKVLYHDNPMEIDRYPIIPYMCYWNSQAPTINLKCKGVIRDLTDVQFLFNRRKRTELDIIESRGASTLLIMEKTLVDDRQAMKTMNGGALFIKSDSPMGLDGVRPLPPPVVGADMMQLSQMLKEEIMQISGVNEELLGASDSDSAGILSALRQGAGLTTLAGIFNNFDFSLMELSRRMMSLQQAHYTPSKVRRILNEDPSPQFYNKCFQKYDVIATNGFLTDTQRQMEFAQKIQLRELGVPISSRSLLESATIQNKDKLIEEIEAQERAQAEAQQQEMQLKMDQIEADSELVRSQTIANSGLGAERYSRIQENKQLAVEREAQAAKDNTDALLNFIKAMQQLDSLDLDNMAKAFQLKEIISPKKTSLESSMEQQFSSGPALQGNQQSNNLTSGAPPL